MMPTAFSKNIVVSGKVLVCIVRTFPKEQGAMTLGRRVLSCAAALALAVFALPSSTRAQSLTGSISGTVADAQGGMLPGADVALTNQESKTVQRTVTNNDGVFVFASVPAG